jgi:competence protein ComEC
VNWRWFGWRLLQSVEKRVEQWLSDERDQIPLWIPAGLAAGIIFWEFIGNASLGIALVITAVLAFIGCAGASGARWRAVVRMAAATFAIGFACIMIKSAVFSAAPIKQMQITEFYGRILKVEELTARQKIRLELQTGGHADLPGKVRVNLSRDQYRKEFVAGSVIRLRARLMPPAGPTLPGAYDFSRKAWFAGLGATGSALGPVSLQSASDQHDMFGDARARMASQIKRALPPDSAAIAIALATGEQGTIAENDAEAMRRSGLAHLLSISGLHVTAVVGAVFLLLSRTLSLFPQFALRQPVPIYAALAAALAAIGYTLLTGAQVPTVRSCIAALMILVALGMGRDALSLRLVAFGATVILVFWPEALAGPSFQLSFAAVSTIIVLHDTKWMRSIAARPAHGIVIRLARGIFGLLVTGIAIEIILAPITLFHFHRTGLYGAMANIIAIPLTTFVIMPFEAAAILLDLVGLGAPFWWVAGHGILSILSIAHFVSDLPGAVATLPGMPNWAFALTVVGVFWSGVFKTRIRWAGLLPICVGIGGIVGAPYPDVLVTGDGKHLAVINAQGKLVLLRPRAGDYVRDSLLENSGIRGDPIAIDEWPGAKCNLDSCVFVIRRGGKDWSILALRTRYNIPAMELASACKRVDIVVSDRWLPYSCKPRWIKADKNLLQQTGGLAFYLGEKRVANVAQQNPNAPWVRAAHADLEAKPAPVKPRTKATIVSVQ